MPKKQSSRDEGISMQIILALEVCEEESLANLKPYPTNL
jgi:hypothetical protein